MLYQSLNNGNCLVCMTAYDLQLLFSSVMLIKIIIKYAHSYISSITTKNIFIP